MPAARASAWAISALRSSAGNTAAFSELPQPRTLPGCVKAVDCRPDAFFPDYDLSRLLLHQCVRARLRNRLVNFGFRAARRDSTEHVTVDNNRHAALRRKEIRHH